ncbi:MAG TPA: FAD-binding oxidoreductase [Dehalococcoidia bacterium]|nr:FAD-binding oxidoreductase [Dehalococcoidia bacterium]
MTQALTIDEAALGKLAQGFRGRLLRPGDSGYDAARTIFNAMIDRRPALIAQPTDTSDVASAVNFARENGLLVSVKGGGHAASGHAVCDDGLMINLSLMKAITVDRPSRIAVAEAGVTWGEFDAATQEHGLAVTGGRVPSTGIAGLTLGSGSGWLERKLGYTVDNMIGAEVVTADGDVLRASEKENPELFWGLRGGGGNYGIVTKFEYRLHPIGPIIFGGMLIFPRPRAAEVIKAYREFIEVAPDDVGGAIALLCAPPEPFVPEPMHGMPILAVVVCYTGRPEDAEQAIKPILDLGPVMNMTQPMPYVELQRMIEGGNQPGFQNYWKADMYAELPDEAIDTLAAVTAEPISTMTAIIVQPIGGAVHRVPDDATAMGWRSAKWALHILGMWDDPAENEKQIAWVRNVAAALQPFAQKGTYLNYLMDEGQRRVEESFGPTFQRMVALKNKYDPTNFFRLNQNIEPTA